MSGPGLEAARRALGGAPAWVVGGAVRDALLGRPTDDADLVVRGNVEEAARAVARAAHAAVFPLGEEFGAWRVAVRGGAWQVDLAPLAGATIEEDLARRDFTLNAMAEPLAGGDVVDPHSGRDDLAARRLRMVSAAALADDPLRTLRAPRLAVELGLEVEPGTARAVRDAAPGLRGVAAERVWGELRRIVRAEDPVAGMRLLETLGLLGPVLPELAALRGVGQSAYHHLDVWEHTLAVLDEVVALQRDPGGALGEAGPAVDEELRADLAEGLTRGDGLRLAAVLHDAAKPGTRVELPDGRIGFPGHDAEGERLARDVLGRLRASERVRAQVAAIVRHHLRLGFLVGSAPLARRTTWDYLVATQPVTVDVTAFTVADRLATRGRGSQAAIAAHLVLARELLAEALAFAPPSPLVRGDELARELGLAPGPELGRLLAELAAARFSGEVATPAEAVAHARTFLAGR